VTIQRMKFRKDGKIHKYNCGVNEMQHGGEFTFCGCAIPDAKMDQFHIDFEPIGEEYIGTIKNITCPDCKRFIVYMKDLE